MLCVDATVISVALEASGAAAGGSCGGALDDFAAAGFGHNAPTDAARAVASEDVAPAVISKGLLEELDEGCVRNSSDDEPVPCSSLLAAKLLPPSGPGASREGLLGSLLEVEDLLTLAEDGNSCA